MAKSIFIKNGTIVNEKKSFKSNILIVDDKIVDIGLFEKPSEAEEIDASNLLVLPGIIDTHANFGDVDFYASGSIKLDTEAAMAGGVTSFIEPPNTVSNITTSTILKKKLSVAKKESAINYSYYLGIENSTERGEINSKRIAAITDNGLIRESLLCNDLKKAEEVILNSGLNANQVVAVHSEDLTLVKKNEKKYFQKYGDAIPFSRHANIISPTACFLAARRIIAKARNINAPLHFLNISTKMETDLFMARVPLKEKKITSEVCVANLHFSPKDYLVLGGLIKCNPAIKSKRNRDALWEGLMDDRIDIISTGHTSIPLEDKQQVYTKCPNGVPMIQHGLSLMLHYAEMGKISIGKVVEKMCHNPAIIFNISKRGFIRKGYKADIVLIDLNNRWEVKKDNILYKYNWSPLEGFKFNSKVVYTFINGRMAYFNGKIAKNNIVPERLRFNYIK